MQFRQLSRFKFNVLDKLEELIGFGSVSKLINLLITMLLQVMEKPIAVSMRTDVLT